MPSNCARLLAVAVHDLRTPLAVIAGYLGLMIRQQSETLSPRQRELLASMERAATSLTALVGELNDLASLESGVLPLKRQQIMLVALMNQVSADVAREGVGKLTVQGVLPGASVVGDEQRLRVALRTLVVGALRESPAPQQVIVHQVVRPTPSGRSAVIAVGRTPSVERLLQAAAGRLMPFDSPNGARNLPAVMACRVIRAHGGSTWMLRGRSEGPGVMIQLPVGSKGKSKVKSKAGRAREG